jgi:hypothetical protein
MNDMDEIEWFNLIQKVIEGMTEWTVNIDHDLFEW